MTLNRRARARSGAMLIQVAFVLPALLAFVALAIDLSLFYVQQAELQVAATSAAAGATLDLPNSVLATAERLVEANLPSEAYGSVLSNSDVEVGHWDGASRTFSANAAPANAVRVTTRMSDSNGNAAQWLVGTFFGLAPLDLSARATAVLLPGLPGAIGGDNSVSLTGNATTDSYDASAGPYDPATATGNGDVATNGNLSIDGTAMVNGDAHGSSISIGGNGSVTGVTSPLSRPLVLPSVDTTVVSGSNNNSMLPLLQQGNRMISPLDGNRNFELTGLANYSIPAGEYYFNNMDISGQSTLTIEGPTTIFLTGDLDTSGGDVINSTQLPNNLRIFMTGGTAILNASVDWYGLLYAPDTDVTVNGTADVFGAVVGLDVSAGGTADVHFDTSLTTGGVISGLGKGSTVVQ